MMLCQDVTPQVMSRVAMEAALEQVRLSKEAAQLGTFDLNIRTGGLDCDKRCRILLGIDHDEKITYKKSLLKGLHPEDRERIVRMIRQICVETENNADHDVEYRTIGLNDQRLRWVRAKGRVFYNEDHLPARFVGSVYDVTKEKLAEFKKNDFVGFASHELKNPLTSLNCILQTVELKLKGNPDNYLAGSIGKALIQVNKMKKIINGFLDLSLFESGKIHLSKTEFSIYDLIAAIVEDLLDTASCIIFLRQQTDITVYADKDKIELVLINLLINALKYSPKGRDIYVTVELSTSEVLVKVTDQGFGVHEQDLVNIFKRYYRADNAATKGVSGFGIGLYISAEIINLHNGRIWAESTLGMGSTFSFALPLSDQ